MARLVLFLYMMNIIWVVIIVFFERKEPSATVVWILIMTYLPGLGVLLYLFFGRGLKFSIESRMRIKRRLEAKYGLLPEPKGLVETTPACSEENNLLQKYSSLIKLHHNMGACQLTGGNHIEICLSAQEKYEKLFHDIANAKTSVHLLYFIIKNDKTGKKLVALLAEKAKEGVAVKVLYDELGSIGTPFRLFAPLKKAGGEVRKFFPFKPGAILRANYRNHRKIAVIDGKTGYIGGMNIGDEYLGLHPKKSPWRDTHLRITGKAVLSLQQRFIMDWFYAEKSEDALIANLNDGNFPETGGDGSTALQIVSSGPDVPGEEIKLGIIKMISLAEKSIYIQSPYLMPDESVLQALYIAAAQGVQITVMLPGTPDKKMIYRVTYSYIEALLSHGIKVYLYNGFIHAKMVVVDGEAVTIGTANLDMRSFRLHFEVNAFIYDKAIGRQCAAIFHEDTRHSRLLTPEAYQKRSVFNKFLEGIFRLFSPLM